MKVKKLNFSLSFCLIQILLSTPFYTAASQNLEGKIYVWEFATRDGVRNDYTRSLTEEFEEALIQSECCEVLQRRLYSRLFDQKQSERTIMKLDGAPEVVINNLKSLEAEAVVFGEVYDDTNSGQVKVTINFESFEGRIIKKASTYLAKYDLANPSKREEAVEKIMGELNIFPAQGKALDTKVIDEWEFSLTGCRRSGNDVTCGFTVTSRHRDRTFSITANNTAYYSGAQDEYSYDYKAQSVKLANQQNTSVLRKFLTADITAIGRLTFLNVSKRAKKFPILYFYVQGDDLSTDHIQFRDVKIQ
ncbi:MAG: hypothetical protein R2824_24075 [Saprospiraceae bacterium]